LTFQEALWTLPIIAKLVEAKFGVVLHPTTISRILHRICVTPQKPVWRAFQRNDEEVPRCVEERFPAVGREVPRKQAGIRFSDATGPNEDHAVRNDVGRARANAGGQDNGRPPKDQHHCGVGAAWPALAPLLQWALTATRYVEIVSALLLDIRGPLVLIHDRHPAHFAAAVRHFIQENPHRLSVHKLPRYGPDANPDEHVWAGVQGMSRRDPVHQDEDFVSGVEATIEHIAGNPQLAESFFGHTAVSRIKQALGW
jgi:hypothetical protein